MRKQIQTILLLLLVAISPSLLAQNSTSSPFSRSVIGELNDNVPNTYRAMGGVGIGMRSNKVISTIQPASYTAGDSLTFMFDLGASVGWSNYKDETGVRNKANGALEYLTLQFPLYKRWVAFSAGILPFSAIGYDITLSGEVENADYHYVKSYTGEGGINQVYGGLSVNLFDWVALGANLYYLFGDATNTRTLTFTESAPIGVAQSVNLHVSSIRLRYGMQFFHTFGDHGFVLGGVFENKSKLGGEYTMVDLSTDLAFEEIKDAFELPMVYGAGLSYNWANRLTVAVDFQRQCFSNAKYYAETHVLADRNRYMGGVEYRHNPMGRNYAERMLWRVGCNVTDPYCWDTKWKEFAVSVGMGFPLRNAGTVFNTTIEYGHRGDIGQLEEHYMRLTFNASIAENWFFKRKL